jgi:hypothetical protein
MLVYLVWQTGYILVVFMWRNEKVERKSYETSYRWMINKSKKLFLHKWCMALGPRYGKHLFVTYQFVYTMVSMLLAYFCFHYHYANVVLVVIVLTVASYNGASFYIDVFSRRYITDSINSKHKNT